MEVHLRANVRMKTDGSSWEYPVTYRPKFNRQRSTNCAKPALLPESLIFSSGFKRPLIPLEIVNNYLFQLFQLDDQLLDCAWVNSNKIIKINSNQIRQR